MGLLVGCIIIASEISVNNLNDSLTIFCRSEM